MQTRLHQHDGIVGKDVKLERKLAGKTKQS